MRPPLKKAAAKPKAKPKPASTPKAVKVEEECENLIEEEGEGEARTEEVLTPSAPDLSVSSPTSVLSPVASSPVASSIVPFQALDVTTDMPMYPTLTRLEGPIPVSKVFEVLATQSSPSDMNNTMLHTASTPSMIPTLIEKNANVEATNDLGHTPFLHHVAAGSWDMCEALLKANADPNAVSHEGNNALHIVSNAALVPHLVKEGVDASALNNELMSPLCCMAERGAFDCAKALLSVKTKDGFAVDVYHRTKSGHTIFDFADGSQLLMDELNDYVIQEFFLKNGPDVNKRDPLGRTALFYVKPTDVEKWVNLGVNMSLKDFKNLTVLTFHASKGHEAHILALLKCGAAASFSTIEDVRMFDGALKKYAKWGTTHKVFSALMDHMNVMSSLKKKDTTESCTKLPVQLSPGDVLDVLDGQVWRVAKIVRDTGRSYLVHFEGWNSTWDREVPKQSEQFAPFGAHTKNPSASCYFVYGSVIDVRCGQAWKVGRVSAILGKFGNERFTVDVGDSQITVGSEDVAPYRTHTDRSGLLVFSLSENEHGTAIVPNAPMKNKLAQYNVWKEGDTLDARDTTNKWLVAKVVKVDPTNADRLLVHYEGWSDKWDDWFTVPNKRLAPLGTHTAFPLNVKAGEMLECNWAGIWHVCKVVEVNADPPKTLICHKGHEEWISIPSDRLAPLGTHALKTGTMLDVQKWYTAIWCTGTVLEFDANKVNVHCEGASGVWDGWIPVTSERLAPLGTHTSAPSSTTPVPFPFNLKDGDAVDALDKMALGVRKWRVAKVLTVNPLQLFIHYDGFADKWDEWVLSDRLAPLGTHTTVSSPSPLLNLKAGDYVDVKEGNKWYPGRVTGNNVGSIEVMATYNQNISHSQSSPSDRLAAFRTKCTEGHLVDVKLNLALCQWHVGEVLERENTGIFVKLVGTNFTNTWIRFSGELAPLGKYTKANAPNVFDPGVRDMVDVFRSGEWVGGMVVAARLDTGMYTVRLENGKKPRVTIAHMLPFRTHSRIPKVSIGDKVDFKRYELIDGWVQCFVVEVHNHECTVQNNSYDIFCQRNIPLTSPRLAAYGTCTNKNSNCLLA